MWAIGSTGAILGNIHRLMSHLQYCKRSCLDAEVLVFKTLLDVPGLGLMAQVYSLSFLLTMSLVEQFIKCSISAVLIYLAFCDFVLNGFSRRE